MRRPTSTGCLTSNPALYAVTASENPLALTSGQIHRERERLDHVELPTGVTDGFPSPSRNFLPPEKIGRALIFAVGAIALLAILATGCTSASKATEALQAEGYSDIRIDGWSAWGCAKDDGTCTKFEARGPTGREVTGAVGCGFLFKGCTVRITGGRP